jgi:hypothetical protein
LVSIRRCHYRANLTICTFLSKSIPEGGRIVKTLFLATFIGLIRQLALSPSYLNAADKKMVVKVLTNKAATKDRIEINFAVFNVRILNSERNPAFFSFTNRLDKRQLIQGAMVPSIGITAVTQLRDDNSRQRLLWSLVSVNHLGNPALTGLAFAS